MKKNIQAVRGMNDYLPVETAIWQYVEHTLKKIINSYGYREIRLPILEYSKLFKKAIGEVTDVVEREMYSFKDRNGKSLTLRPDGTSSCVRAGIEHNLLKNQEQRLWYIGSMFRYERPQQGRYRQFNQLGVEVFGLQSPDIDAELIMLITRCWNKLGITKYVSLELNSIGSPETRLRYCSVFIKFLEKHKNMLDEDCHRRMKNNPLRILDSKNPNIQALLDNAPVFSDYLDDGSQEHFSDLCRLLKESNISYTVNRRLVRGLDYYNRTVFEWTTTNLDSKKTVCAGGRYDYLVENLGGNSTPAVGFAIGLERLVLLIQNVNIKLKINSAVDVYFIVLGAEKQSIAMLLSERIRDVLPNIKLITDHKGGSLKKQFIRANRHGAKIVLILGKLEIATKKIVVKDLCSGKQEMIMQSDITEYLRIFFNF